MSSLQEDFVSLIQKSDVDALRIFLDKNPGMLMQQTTAGGNDTYSLHNAAKFNRPDIIEFLVMEKGVDVNWKDKHASRLPLLFAKVNSSYAAAAMLVSLGADPSLGGDEMISFCRSENVQRLLDPEYQDKINAKRVAGAWIRAAKKQVIHTYELPGLPHRLTEVFNFESRHFISIVETDKGVSHTTHFFDEMPDKTVLFQALERLKDLGGDADESLIDRPPSIKRVLKPGN